MSYSAGACTHCRGTGTGEELRADRLRRGLSQRQESLRPMKFLVRRAVNHNDYNLECDGCQRLSVRPGDAYREVVVGPAGYFDVCEARWWPRLVELIALAARRSRTVTSR